MTQLKDENQNKINIIDIEWEIIGISDHYFDSDARLFVQVQWSDTILPMTSNTRKALRKYRHQIYSGVYLDKQQTAMIVHWKASYEPATNLHPYAIETLQNYVSRKGVPVCASCYQIRRVKNKAYCNRC